MIDAKEDEAKMQRSKYQYYRYVEMERKLRKKISNAKIAQDQQRVDDYDKNIVQGRQGRQGRILLFRLKLPALG